MVFLKVGWAALLACYTYYLVDAAEKQKIYIRGVSCNASAKFVNPGLKCFAKSYNRSFSTFNVIGTTKMPLYDLNVRNFILEQGAGTNLFLTRESFDYPIVTEIFTGRWCTRRTSTSVLWWRSWTPATFCCNFFWTFPTKLRQAHSTSVLTQWRYEILVDLNIDLKSLFAGSQPSQH